ncbi:sugar ABC transporter permease [Ideonella sp. 4Y11]|uniref:Sugar ABC transporter permease n=2 Tax=Ideonella aquatica TaxID=2824119 RepID=A0A941BJR3_9BURK|nr:sugar ABC transporter permease [Ideonella aquatica]
MIAEVNANNISAMTDHEAPAQAAWRTALPGREAWTAWAMIAPALLGFVLFYALPALRAVEISFTDWNLLRPPRDVGWANYQRLWHDERFWQGMKLSLGYALMNIPLQTMLGLGLAVAMDRLTRSLFVKSVVLLPYLLSNVLVALVWLWMLDPALGAVNALIEQLGGERQPFFSGADQALATVAAVNVWRHMGLVAMLFLAGLQNIPRTLYEAAAMEGASEWQMFRRITLPLLRPVMVFVLVTSVTGSLQIFDTVAVTTKGGPQDATRVIVHYIVQNAFGFLKMGYASAMSMVLCAVMLLYTVLQMRLMRADQNDLA